MAAGVMKGIGGRIAAGAGLAGLLLLIAGCSAQKVDSTIPPCPDVGILSDASRLVQYRDGPGRDLSDVVFEAEMPGVKGDCEYDRRRTRVTVNLRLAVTALRGPADQKRGADFGYFVAIVDKQGEVVARQEFQSHIDFPPNIARVATVEELEQRIPLKQDVAAADYQIMIGFKLNADQVERNRSGLR